MHGCYDPWTVLFSFLIAWLAGFVALETVYHTRASSRRGLWILAGGLTLGLGIWSMHFTGMLAWVPPFPLFYALRETLLSILLAVTSSSLAMYLVARSGATTAPWRKLAGALVVGGGICAMHYEGMQALRLDGPVHWSPGWVTASFFIAILGALAALRLFDTGDSAAKSLRGQTLASLIIGIAICGMHFAGMQALMLSPGTRSLPGALSFSGPALARVGVGNTLLFTLVLLVSSYRDRVHLAREATEARFQAQEASRQAERLAAAGKIAASIAHEINNPLEAITNLLFLMEHGNLNEEQRSYLKTAQSELRRIAEITTHTLRFYRQQSEPEKTSVPALLESALNLFEPRLLSRGIAVEKQWDDSEQYSIVCRSGEIRQVLANLVGNAIDSMSEGGTLRLMVQPNGNYLEIIVADTGKGIPEHLQARIMEPFFTTKGLAGTGLGLSISAEIIARHGGTLTFSSVTEPGSSGTTFRITLPLSASPIMAGEDSGLNLHAVACPALPSDAMHTEDQPAS